MSLSPYEQDNIESWVSDFCDSTRYTTLPHAAKEYAAQILVELLTQACQHRTVAPSEITEQDLRHSLLQNLAKLPFPESVKLEIPNLCRAFLEELETQGRLGGGADLGRYVAALHHAFAEAASPRVKPIENKSTKISRNDPCPCGSGRKYKKCCMRLLDAD